MKNINKYINTRFLVIIIIVALIIVAVIMKEGLSRKKLLDIEIKAQVVPNPDEKFSEIYTENKIIIEGNYQAVIPKGFAVGTTEGINSILDGLVITDAVNEEGQSIGNEFVWIPVMFETTGEKDENGLYLDFINTFARENVGTEYYTEPYESGYTQPTKEIEDYYDMMVSIQNNRGFYVGRYEAGSQKLDYKGNIIARSNVANGTSKVVVKRDQYPYIYVGWGKTISNYTDEVIHESKNQGKGAVYLCKNLLEGKSTGATSTLIYGVQWDAMLNFMGKSNDENSTEWGNYKNSQIVIDRKEAKYTLDPSDYSTWIPIGETTEKKSKMLLTTGASDEFKVKNIYDVAGNVNEWTMEAAAFNTRVYRGGAFGNKDGGNFPAPNRRDVSTNYCVNSRGFRPALYITNE